MHDDGPLPLARRRLTDAVHSWADPIPVWADGLCRWTDPLYQRLRDALHGGNIRRSGSMRTVPCRVEVLDLLLDVDASVAAWMVGGKGDTADRLHQLADYRWRPQDCELIDDMCDWLERWAVAADLLGDTTTVVALRLPCPSCGARLVDRRTAAGDVVRAWALRVSEDGFTKCSGCAAFWPASEFHWLARLLGCAPLPV